MHIQVRTQEHRYWVQVESQPVGAITGFAHLDLNMVDQIYVDREPTGEVRAVAIITAAQMKPLQLKGQSAQEFFDIWSEFIGELKHVSTKAAPGLLLTPESDGVIKR